MLLLRDLCSAEPREMEGEANDALPGGTPRNRSTEAASLSEEATAAAETAPSEEEIEASVIAEINRDYPTAESLVGLDTRLSEVSVQLQETEQRILSAVRRQAELTSQRLPEKSGVQGEKTTEQKVKDLLEMCRQVREAAAATDADVAALCAGLKMLDTAKTNLTKSITTLKQALMLAAACNQLREAAGRRRYSEASQLVQAALPLQTAFALYSHVPSIAQLLHQLQHLREALLQQVQEDFEAALDPDAHAQGPPLTAEETKTLLEGARCIDSLGLPFARQQLLGSVCSALLTPYCRLFHPAASPETLDLFAGSEAAGAAGRVDPSELKGVSNFLERRFAWLRRALREFDAGAGSLFPPHWSVKEKLAEAFCRVTRQQLAVRKRLLALYISAKKTTPLSEELVEKSLMPVLFAFPLLGVSAQDALGGAQPNAPPPKVLSLVKEMQLFEQRLESRFSAERRQLQLLLESEGQTRRSASLPRVLATATVASVQKAARESGEEGLQASALAEAERLAKEVAAEGADSSAAGNASEAEAVCQLPPPVCFRGLLTSSLDFFLTGWAPFEEQQLQQRLQRALAEDRILLRGVRLQPSTASPLEDDFFAADTNPFAEEAQECGASARQPLEVASGDDVGCLYTSATEVFVACKGALERTSAVSTQQTLAEVVAAFKRLLERYFEALRKR